MAQGIERGLAEGVAQGMARGREKGRAEGREQTMAEITRKMKEMGDPAEKIYAVTGLSADAVGKL